MIYRTRDGQGLVVRVAGEAKSVAGIQEMLIQRKLCVLCMRKQAWGGGGRGRDLPEITQHPGTVGCHLRVPTVDVCASHAADAVSGKLGL